MPDFPVSGAVLAGGRSSRMGRDKAFMPLDGRTLIARQCALLREVGVTDLIISGRPAVDYGEPDARVVCDPVADAGPLAGLTAIFITARHPWVLVLAVDLPRLTADYLRTLLTLGAGQTGVVPHGPHGYEPLAALYPRALLPTFENALAAGRLSLQDAVHHSIQTAYLRAVKIPESDLFQFENWNTPGDAGRPG